MFAFGIFTRRNRSALPETPDEPIFFVSSAAILGSVGLVET
jgi:hypothetical protein